MNDTIDDRPRDTNDTVSPFRKAAREARTLLLPILLLAVGFNLFASNALPWKRELPETVETSDEDLFGDTNDTDAVIDTVPPDTIPLDTGEMTTEEMEKRRLDSLKRAQDSITQWRRDSARVAKEKADKEKEKPVEIVGEGVTLAQMKRLFDEKRAFIIDARRSDQFAKGHIPGATNIYASEFAQNIPKVGALPKDRLIVVYCDGGACELSHQLTADLKAFGFTNVKIFSGGWEEWGESSYPKKTGAE